jgi:phosphoglycolate phosphatase-like HAD superfamily hydrolase
MHFRIGLVTGNCRNGGIVKLTSAKLHEYFEPELSFYATFELYDRQKILASAREKHTDIIIIGDTPNDVQAGVMLNIPVISVATGSFSWTDLEEINKDFVLKEDWKVQNLMDILNTKIN